MKTNHRISSTRLRWFFPGFFLAEGLIAFGFLALIPSDAEGGILFGLSASRLALMTVHSALLAFLFILLWTDLFRKPFLHLKLGSAENKVSEKWIGLLSVLLMVSTLIPLQILLSLYQTTGSFREYAYFQRLLPTLGWLFLVGFQLAVWLVVKKRAAIIKTISANQSALKPAAVVFSIFLAAGLFSTFTGIGLREDKYGWGAPGVPLMEWQIWASLLFAILAVMVLGGTHAPRLPLSRKDIWIGVGIWLAAVILWSAQPVPPGFFATPGRLPNFEIYPFSDGAFYDFYAQNIVIGNGYRGEQIPPRPLYILFLALAHLIVGQDYNLVVFVQTLLLAFIPVVIFLLGRSMHSTTAGLAAAGMAILREITTILSTPFTDDVSNSKLLFADLPSTLGIAALILLVVLWLRDPWKRSALQMASGLAMGVLLLVRTQSLLILPVIFIIAFWIYRRNLRQFCVDFGFFLLAMSVCIAPWLIRNYSIAGAFIFDHPESQSRVMAQRYDFEGNFDRHERLPGEDTGVYSDRLTTAIKQTIINHPLYVAEFVTAHFLNNEISDLLILPIRSSLISPRELIFPTAPFWQEWNGITSWPQALLLTANLFVICLGIGFSWKKFGLLGLFPLFVNLAYNLSTAVARFSGWRYLLPVDWIAYFYYAIGLTAICGMLFNKIVRTDIIMDQGEAVAPATSTSRDVQIPPVGRAILIFSISLMVGASLLLAESVIPRRYSQADNDLVLTTMLENPVVKSSGIDLEALAQMEAQPNSFIVRGRAMYPRFYDTGEGEAKTAKTGYAPGPDARLVFLVASKPDGLTIFRTQMVPDYFPNAVDVSIVGCQHPLFAEALIITVHGEREETYISPDASSFICTE